LTGLEQRGRELEIGGLASDGLGGAGLWFRRSSGVARTVALGMIVFLELDWAPLALANGAQD
jgi:hypothetical protein